METYFIALALFGLWLAKGVEKKISRMEESINEKLSDIKGTVDDAHDKMFGE